MASPSHRSSASVSAANLVPPSGSPINRQRRMTSPSLPPPPSPLNLPEPVYGNRRPPSPLRNGFSADPESESGSDNESENGHQWGERPQSPSASVQQFAANIAQRVGSLMSNMSQRSPNYLPTDEELEAEAEREREKSRREAELIMSREAETKRLEERVLAMLDGDHTSPNLPPPPPIDQGTPRTPPSPSPSQKERWWSLAKTKLTPTKDPLTPAQQIIQEAKQRDKEIEKERKEIEKEKKEIQKELKKQEKQAKKYQDKSKSAQWPSSPEDKFQDPAFLKLHTNVPHPQRPMNSSPVSPSPARVPVPSIPPSLAPSPVRGPSESTTASPSRGATPMYAIFNQHGVLDIPATLITIAQRFEKLEKWTVSHTRALEERMDDVERWLVDKEQEKELGSQKPVETQQTGDLAPADALNEIREELAEVQGRIGELGREMAKMVTAPGNLSSGPSRSPPGLGRAPSTSSSIAVRSISANLVHTTRTPPRSREPTTSPTTSPPPVGSASRTRLPYPTGDYATPPDSVVIGQGPFSPPNSPPPSTLRGPRMSISGLPGGSPEPSSSTSGLPVRATSPPTLHTPSSTQRQSSVSPTPRKRYTVALGEPIMNPESRSREYGQPAELATATFSSSPKSMKSLSTQDTDDDDSYYDLNDETIGKAAARQAGLTAPLNLQDRRNSVSPSPSPKPQKRARPQSMYNGPATARNVGAPSTSSHSRLRSKSTDRYGLGLGLSDGVSPSSSSTSLNRFVDPLVIRKQTKDALASAAPPPPKVMTGRPKVPVGQLVAFFDQDK
ncbi:hypothetical protein QCA50_013028 [Cerrena zonata]|uniref:Uncharacterized protein n=1 Tax=Cerrena zonata TaxID=2478898 RepID=A0AAW0G263_9APHY